MYLESASLGLSALESGDSIASRSSHEKNTSAAATRSDHKPITASLPTHGRLAKSSGVLTSSIVPRCSSHLGAMSWDTVELSVCHTLQPEQWITRTLLKPQLPAEAYVVRTYRQHGWICTLISNPLPENLAKLLQNEPAGFVLLVSRGESCEMPDPCMDILRRVFRTSLRTKANTVQWSAILRLLKRVNYNDHDRVLFAINVTDPRQTPKLVSHFAMAGGICAADALLGAATRESGSHGPEKLRWHQSEEVQVFRRHLNGEDIVTVMLTEKFDSLEDRIFAAWICKHISGARTRAAHRSTANSSTRSWNFKMSLTAPKGRQKSASSVWILWEFRNALEVGNSAAPEICSTLVAFRSFLQQSIRQLKRKIDDDVNRTIAKILNGP